MAPRLNLVPAIAAACALAVTASAQQKQIVSLRGHEQTLHIYGVPASEPIIVSSGDGGWIHLAPHIASFLSQRGFYVVGFDVRAYLASFTAGGATLDASLEPDDYATLAELAARTAAKKPLLVGVSEGAGLSLLAATNPRVKALIAGVIGVGLPDINELGWRWRDSVIYFSHKVPNEPTFSTAAVVANVAPVPLAAIHSSHDEFVPVADVRRIIDRAGEPKRLWIVNASDHRFSSNMAEFDARLIEAIDWIRQDALK